MTDEYKKLRILLYQGAELYYAPQVIPNSVNTYIVPLIIKHLTKRYIEVVTTNNETLQLNIFFGNNISRIFTSQIDAELDIIKQYRLLKAEYDNLNIYVTQFDQLQKDKPYLVI